MKRLIIFLLLFAAIKVAGQTTGYLRFDTVLIYKQGGTAELALMNKTKDTLGVLTNYGNGRTKFIKSRALNDSTIVVGLDTLTIRGGGGGSKWEYDIDNNLVNKSFPGAKVEIDKRLSILDSGYVASGPLSGTNPGEGTGYKNFWYQGKAAYRSGFTDASSFNDAFIGLYSSSFGYNATATGLASTAFGIGTLASGQASIAFGGSGTQATGNNSTAGGLGSTAGGLAATAFGNSSSAAGASSFAAGFGPAANGIGSAAFNGTTRANGQYSAAFGEGSDANAVSGFVAGRFNQTNYSQIVPQFVIGRYSDTTKGAELFRIGWGSPSGGSKLNIFSIDTAGQHKIMEPDDATTGYSVLVWDPVDSMQKKVDVGDIGGGEITTIVDSPLYVKAGDPDNDIPDTLSIHRATTTIDGYLSASDKAKYDSAYKAFYNAFAGDTSIMILGGVIRAFRNVSTDSVTWAWIIDSDHAPLNFTTTVTANGPSNTITINYPTSVRVITLIAAPDERYASYGVQLGSSVGLSSATILPRVQFHWGGYILANGSGGYGATGGYNTSIPTVTYNSSTGQISLAVSQIRDVGGDRDWYKISATTMKNGYNIRYDINGSSGSSMKFYFYDMLGNDFTGPSNTGMGFWYKGVSSFPGIDTQYFGGSNTWLQQIFEAPGNFWVIAVLKRH